MAENEPRLRVVDEANERPAPGAAPRPPRRERWLLIALVVALVVTVALLGWSRSQLGAEIQALESRTADLERQVEARDRVIDAHEGRLDDVRARVDQLRTLLDEPVRPGH